jgi:hypothetical protein
MRGPLQDEALDIKRLERKRTLEEQNHLTNVEHLKNLTLNRWIEGMVRCSHLLSRLHCLASF